MIIFLTTIAGLLLFFAGGRILFTSHFVLSGDRSLPKFLWPVLVLTANIHIIVMLDHPVQIRGQTLTRKEKNLFGGMFMVVGILVMVIAQIVI